MVLSRVYELRDEIPAFLTDKLSPLASQFSDEKWLLTLSYLADIISVLNELNLKLQGREDNIFRHCEQIQAFQKSLELWQLRLKTASYYLFPTYWRNALKKTMCPTNRSLAWRVSFSHIWMHWWGNFLANFPRQVRWIKRQAVGEKSLWLWNSRFNCWTEFNSFWRIRNDPTNQWQHFENSSQNRKIVFVLDWPLHRVSHAEQSKHFIATTLHHYLYVWNWILSFNQNEDETTKQTECFSGHACCPLILRTGLGPNYAE